MKRTGRRSASGAQVTPPAKNPNAKLLTTYAPVVGSMPRSV